MVGGREGRHQRCMGQGSILMSALAAALLSSPLSGTPAKALGGDDQLVPITAPPVLLLNDGWVKLETDSCGSLEGMGGGRANLRLQPSDFGLFDDDDFDDPQFQERMMVSQWLSSHVEIAAISDGVDKWCNEQWFDGEEMPTDTIA
jgi:hypothetical protein